MQRAIGCFRGKELGSFCWPMLAAGIAALMHLVDVLSILLICNGFSGIQKALVDQTGSRPPNSDHDFFWCKFGFRKCFGASSWSSHWDGHHWLSYKIHLSLHDTIQARNSWLHRIKGDNSSKWWFFFFFFWLAVSSWVPTYWDFSSLQFASNAEWP